jgi:hypothetical protein
MGKEYLVLQVKYEEGGKMYGTLFWSKTYAMKFTSFTTMRQKNDGNILLMEEETSLE